MIHRLPLPRHPLAFTVLVALLTGMLISLILRTLTGRWPAAALAPHLPGQSEALAGVLLLGLVLAAGLVSGWHLMRQQRAAWKWVLTLTEEASLQQAGPEQSGPVSAGPLVVGEEAIPLVRTSTSEDGLLLWRPGEPARLLRWRQLLRLWPMSDSDGVVRAVIVELAGRRWGPDRFTAPWNDELNARLLREQNVRVRQVRPRNLRDG
ncbi:MAG: hypothetical protein JJT85_10140 [Chromatiales bacterium]|nr:hypothetical protein [Chromatiales bacterium]